MTTTRERRGSRQFHRGLIWHDVQLADRWKRLSYRHFRGKLHHPAPTIRFADPVTPGALGTFAVYGDGLTEVCIDPDLVTGNHPDIDHTAPETGRWRFIEDTVLHEMVHCAVHRLNRWDQESTHRGAFAALASGISSELGLPLTRNWEAWPYVVRPSDYYLGAYRPQHRPTNTAPHTELAALVAAIDAATEQIRRTLPPVGSR